MPVTVRFCLDADTLIQAKNSYYSFDLVPRFWEWIDTQYKKGRICSSSMVCKELMEGKGRLAQWAKERRHSGMFEQPGKRGQEAYRKVAEYVSSGHYPQHHYAQFLKGADAWVIAQAKAGSYSLVTMEKSAGEGSRKLKIPDVATAVGVEVVDFFKMLRILGFSESR